MELLPKTFTKLGFTYQQLVDQHPFYIYEQRQGGEVSSYEVIKATQNKAGDRFGKFYEARESYPSVESWGTQGFTFSTLEEANEYLPTFRHKTRVLASRKPHKGLLVAA